MLLPRFIRWHDARDVHLSPASLNQAIRLLEQPVAADSRPPANTRGETGREHLR